MPFSRPHPPFCGYLQLLGVALGIFLGIFLLSSGISAGNPSRLRVGSVVGPRVSHFRGSSSVSPGFGDRFRGRRKGLAQASTGNWEEEKSVQIVTTQGCKFCTLAKQTLKDRGVPYEELSVAGEPTLLSTVASVSGIRTVPQIFVNGAFVGDCDRLLSLDPDVFFTSGDTSKTLPDTTLERLRAAGEAGNEIKNSAIASILADTGDEKAAEMAISQTPVKGMPLNIAYQYTGQALPAGEVSQALQNGMTSLFDKHASEGGKALDYNGVKNDKDFVNLVRLAHSLQTCDPSSLSAGERMSFFINIYNALIVHAMTILGPPESFLSRMNFYNDVKYNIGGSIYSCNDIENGVLRGNRASPASVGEVLPFVKSKGPFKEGDPRLPLVIKSPDPRIHFALNCGAKSCPAIKVYTPDTLEIGLQSAAEAFCSDPSNVDFDADSNTLKLSKIFQWYRGDFGSDSEFYELLKQAAVGERGKQLGTFLDNSKEVKVEFVPYDWDLNSA